MQHSLRRRDGYQLYASPRLRGRVGGRHYSMQRKRHQQSGQQACEYGIVRDHGSQSEGWVFGAGEHSVRAGGRRPKG